MKRLKWNNAKTRRLQRDAWKRLKQIDAHIAVVQIEEYIKFLEQYAENFRTDEELPDMSEFFDTMFNSPRYRATPQEGNEE